MKKVAVVGLGIMGSGIANNFLKNDYEVHVWNRTKANAARLIARGAIWSNSPAEATKKANLAFEVTANDESSREVWLAKNGILAGADRSKSLITCATLSVKWVDELIENCQKNGFGLFDMPMTGGRIAAKRGELTLLIGGNERKLDKLKPDLSAIAKDLKYFGSAGAGTRYKLVLNMLQAIHIAGFGEALKLARVAGLDEKTVGEALKERPGGALTALAWEGYQKQPEPINFSVQWIAKDLHYAKQLAADLRLPFLEQVIQVYERAISQGLAKSDWTKITKL